MLPLCYSLLKHVRTIQTTDQLTRENTFVFVTLIKYVVLDIRHNMKQARP
jgi:hypothetical protein